MSERFEVVASNKISSSDFNKLLFWKKLWWLNYAFYFILPTIFMHYMH